MAAGAFERATNYGWRSSLTWSVALATNSRSPKCTRDNSQELWQPGLAVQFQLSKALTKRIRKSTQVFHAFRLATHLCWLALALVELKFVRKSAKVFTVWPPNTSWQQVICICVKCTAFDDLHAWHCEPTSESVWSPIASSGFVNLRWLASTCESVWPELKSCIFCLSMHHVSVLIVKTFRSAGLTGSNC